MSAHADTYGVTAMLRVGCTRIFEVGGLPYRGTVFTSYPMPHGSLVTMKRSLQHKAEPQSDKGECVSIIFRFVTDGQTTSQWYDADKKIEGKMRRQHKKTYDRAVQDYKKGRAYAAAAQ